MLKKTRRLQQLARWPCNLCFSHIHPPLSGFENFLCHVRGALCTGPFPSQLIPATFPRPLAMIEQLNEQCCSLIASFLDPWELRGLASVSTSARDLTRTRPHHGNAFEIKFNVYVSHECIKKYPGANRVISSAVSEFDSARHEAFNISQVTDFVTLWKRWTCLI